MNRGSRAQWSVLPLGEVATFQRGFDITKAEQGDGPYPVVTSSGPTSTHSQFRVRGAGVVIGRKGTLGTVFFVEGNYWPHDTTLWVKDFHGNDPRFVYYLLKTMRLEKYDCGASNPTINRNHIHPLAVKVPPIGDQVRISAVLSAYDDLIANNTRRIKILEEMAQAIYREWFVHFRFPGHKKGKLANSPLGPIPHGWEVKRATDAITVDPPTLVPREGEKPFVPMSSLSSDSMLVHDFELRTGNSGSKFRNGDTLFARITPCLENGKTAFVQFLPADQDVAFGSTEFIVLRSKTLCPEFVYLLARSVDFRSNAIKSMSGASGRQRVQPACFDKFMFAHPDPMTLGTFAEHAAPMFGAIQLLAVKNGNLRKARDILRPKLISGELNVSELDIKVGDEAA